MRSSARLQLVPSNWTPRVAGRAYDALATRWPEIRYGKVDLSWRQWVYPWLLQTGLLEGDVLDLGCGDGALLDFVPMDVERYVGVDTSLGMLALAGTKYRGYHFLPRDMSDTGFPAEELDSIVCLFGAFSYAERPLDLVAEIYRLLRKRGRFCVMPYGPRFNRPLYLDGIPVERNVFTAEQLRMFFQAFDNVEVRALARRTPPLWLPQGFHNWWCRWEQRKPREGDGQFLIVTGRK